MRAFGEVARADEQCRHRAGRRAVGELSSAGSTVLGINLWGVINGVQTFAPAMIAQGTPGAIVNTGSKQGITTPPGDTAYNVCKAGVKVLTEALAARAAQHPRLQGERASAGAGLRPITGSPAAPRRRSRPAPGRPSRWSTC